MRTLLILSLLLSTNAFANLLPAEKSEAVVSDELFSYQWSLFNQGQTYLKERDDIHNIPLKGLTGKDIDWKSFKDKLGTKRPVVAILDTGVNYTHAAFGNCTSPGMPEACRVSAAVEVALNDGALDDNGHGTNVAAIALGVAALPVIYDVVRKKKTTV